MTIPLWLTAVLLAVYVPHAVALSVADARWHRLPNRLIASLAVGTVGLGTAVCSLTGETERLVVAMTAGLVVLLVAVGTSLCLPSALGMGDAKLFGPVAFTAALYGWLPLVLALVVPVVAAGAVALAAIGLRRIDRGGRMAFGPYLLLGPPVAVAVSPAVAGAWGLA